jgi:hypothetical protein
VSDDQTPPIDWSSPLPDLTDLLTIEDPAEAFRRAFELAQLYRTLLRAALALAQQQDRTIDALRGRRR